MLRLTRVNANNSEVVSTSNVKGTGMGSTEGMSEKRWGEVLTSDEANSDGADQVEPARHARLIKLIRPDVVSEIEGVEAQDWQGIRRRGRRHCNQGDGWIADKEVSIGAAQRGMRSVWV